MSNKDRLETAAAAFRTAYEDGVTGNTAIAPAMNLAGVLRRNGDSEAADSLITWARVDEDARGVKLAHD